MSGPTPPDQRAPRGGPATSSDPERGGILSIKLWQLLAAVLGAAIFLWLMTILGGWAILLLVLMTIAFVVARAYIVVRRRVAQRHSLLWMLAIASEHRMPLAMTVEAFADQYRGGFRGRVLRLSALLRQGVSLSQGLRSVHGLATGESTMLVEMGEESGDLPGALRRATSVQSERSEIGSLLASQASYLLFVFLVGQAICLFLIYFIAPKFEAIFMDFGISLPESTRFVLRSGNTLVYYWVPIWLPIATIVVLVGLQRTLAGGAGMDLPLLGRFFPRRHTGRILGALAMTARASRPIEHGLRILAKRYPTGWIRTRLAKAESEVRSGRDWRDALAEAGLLRPVDREALFAAGAAGNLPWAMVDLGDAFDRRWRLRMELLARSLWPLAILAFGGLILLLAVAFFAPLVELIGRLSG